jgi:uncharacterized protein (TIGR02996 family)
VAGFKWVRGIATYNEVIRSLCEAILAAPDDTNNRLVLADAIQELPHSSAEKTAASLRSSGYWTIGGAVGRRNWGMTWWQNDYLSATYSASGLVICFLRRDRIPFCCTAKPRYVAGCYLTVAGHRATWNCYYCKYYEEH